MSVRIKGEPPGYLAFKIWSKGRFESIRNKTMSLFDWFNSKWIAKIRILLLYSFWERGQKCATVHLLDVCEYSQHWINDHFTHALHNNAENLFLNNITIFFWPSVHVLFTRVCVCVWCLRLFLSILSQSKLKIIRKCFYRRVQCTLFSKVPKFPWLFVSIIKFAKSDHKFPYFWCKMV